MVVDIKMSFARDVTAHMGAKDGIEKTGGENEVVVHLGRAGLEE